MSAAVPDVPHRHAREQAKIYRNSLILVGSTAATAGIGFLFWAVVAHAYSSSQVGLATSLVSAISLISYMSLFGLNSTLIRFPAPAGRRGAQVTWSMVITGAGAALFAGVYLLTLPRFASRLTFVHANPEYAVLFVVVCVCSAVNLLTDSVFIGARMPQFNVVADGAVQGLARLALPLTLAGYGAMGIVGAMGGGSAAAVLASLVLMAWRLGYRPSLRTKQTRLREQAGFSLASYVSSLLNLLPLLVLPLIALQRLGAQAAGYYYIAFQIATLLNAAGHAVGDAVFSEASHDPGSMAALLRRSALIMTALLVPATVAVSFGGGLILDLFGAEYRGHAAGLLRVLAVGTLAVAFNTWATNALRVDRRLGPMVFSNLVLSVGTVGMALATVSRGLVWLGWSWDAGNLASGLAAAVFLPGRARALESVRSDEGAGATEPTAQPAAEPAGAQWWSTLPFDDQPTLPLVLPWNLAFSGRQRARTPPAASQGSAGPAEDREW